MVTSTNPNWKLQISINEKLYLRDPQHSELGNRILNYGVKLIDELGLEEFTFRKLAQKLGTNESSIYRYFENKHRLLLYVTQWYWQWLEYQLVTQLQHNPSIDEKIEILVNVLIMRGEGLLPDPATMDKKALHRVVIQESSKAYLTRHVYEDNRNQFFKPYKDFCSRVASIIQEYNPTYKFPRSLSSTIIEMSHYQYFFMNNLPSLTDFGDSKNEHYLTAFLKDLIYSSKR